MESREIGNLERIDKKEVHYYKEKDHRGHRELNLFLTSFTVMDARSHGHMYYIYTCISAIAHNLVTIRDSFKRLFFCR